MSKIFGYCRISRKSQSIERQIRNILKLYPEAEIFHEVYTGTKLQHRPMWTRLLKNVKPGDTIVFDSVSRMSRNAQEGISQYMDFYFQGVNLIFLKESYINTDVYRSTSEQSLKITGNEIADIYIEATNKVIKLLAEKQIEKAFEQAQKEVEDLHQRTKEGIETARINGKQIGQVSGRKLNVKKATRAKILIKKYSRFFEGTLKDVDVIKLVGISNNTYYKYKRELMEEI